MKAQNEPLSQLAKLALPDNPKKHNMGDIHQSYDRFGYAQRIVINDVTNHILAGHGRIEGLMQKKALGESAPQNIIVKPDDWYVPTDRIEIEEEEELACAIALNKIGENEWDNEKTTRILARYASDDNLGGTGFDNDDVDYLLRKTAPQELPQVVSDEELNKYREEKAHWRWLRLRVTEESYDRWLLFRQKSNMQNDDQILDFLLNLVGDDLMEKL